MNTPPWFRTPCFTALPLLLALALLPGRSEAGAAMYRFDPVHSQVLFSIDHNGYSRPFGRLHIARGWLRFDPDHWEASATELDIDLASLDMGDAAWDKALAASDFFDTDRQRYAHFVSTSVEHSGANQGVLHGTLTLRGVSRPVSIPFRWNRTAKTIYGMHTVAGFSGTASLQRGDFGMRSNPNVIGQNVNIWLEIEAIADDHARQQAGFNEKEQP